MRLLVMQNACDAEQLIMAHNGYLSDAKKLCAAPPSITGEAAAVSGGRLEVVLRVCHDLVLLRCGSDVATYPSNRFWDVLSCHFC